MRGSKQLRIFIGGGCWSSVGREKGKVDALRVISEMAFRVRARSRATVRSTAFGGDGRVGFVATLFLWKLGYPKKGIVREKKRLYTNHKSLHIHLLFFDSRLNS